VSCLEVNGIRTVLLRWNGADMTYGATICVLRHRLNKGSRLWTVSIRIRTGELTL